MPELKNITIDDFQRVWLRCVETIDLIVASQGYAALTIANISRKSGFSEATLFRCFVSLENLLFMYDQLTMICQVVKWRSGQVPTN